MKPDYQIQKDVMSQLNFEPALLAHEIGVAVHDGIVSLTGRVDSYAKKMTAEKAAQRIAGVRAVAEEIKVGLSPVNSKSDDEIAAAVAAALRWHSAVQEDKIRIRVEEGVVTLEGEADWEYQRKAAKTAIEHLVGVRMVLNLVTLKPAVSMEDVHKKINAALERSALIDAQRISVEVTGNRVVLRGSVSSFAEKEDAEYAAWSAHGVTAVDNQLRIKAEEFAY